MPGAVLCARHFYGTNSDWGHALLSVSDLADGDVNRSLGVRRDMGRRDKIAR